MDGEKIIGAIFGVLGRPSSSFSLKKGAIESQWPRRQLGRSREPDPSNALIFTDRRVFIMFIEISSHFFLIGGKKHLDETRQIGEKMISTSTPEQILNSNTHNIAIPYEEIAEVILNRKREDEGSINDAFHMKTINNEKLRYGFGQKEDVNKLEQILLNVLQSKTTINTGKLIR